MNTNVIKKFLIDSRRYFNAAPASAARPAVRKPLAHLIALALSTGVTATCLAGTGQLQPNTRILAVTPAAAQNADAPKAADPVVADAPKSTVKRGHQHKKTSRKGRRRKTRIAASA